MDSNEAEDYDAQKENMAEKRERINEAEKVIKYEEDKIRKWEAILQKTADMKKAAQEEDNQQANLLKEEIMKLNDEMTAEEKEFGENLLKEKAEKEKLAKDIQIFRERKRMTQETFLTITPEMLDGQELMIHVKHKSQMQYVFWRKSWAGWSDGKNRSEGSVKEYE